MVQGQILMRAGVDKSADLIPPPEDHQGKAIDLQTRRLTFRRVFHQADNGAFRWRARIGFPCIGHVPTIAPCRTPVNLIALVRRID